MQGAKSPLYRLLLGASLFLAIAAPAFSTTVEVGSCVSGLVQFPTIQTAINQSPAGTTIEICPGQYPEQISINKRLTLRGIVSAPSGAVELISPSNGLQQNAVDLDNPQLPVAAQILVQSPATGVVLNDLTVDAANNQIGGCSPELVGILFQNASGTVNHAAVRNQYLGSGLNGCQSGLGIYVQTASGSFSTVTVENSTVHDYQKNGITGNDPNTTLLAMTNDVRGFGVVAPPGAAQNGIQIAFGAAGKVTGNNVIDNIYGDPTIAASADILLYDAAEDGSITVGSNTIGNSQIPIGIYTDEQYGSGQYGDGVTVQFNKIQGTLTYDAIDVCTNGNFILNNTIMDSTESAIHMDASCSANGNTTGNNNNAHANTINESACAGVLVDSATTGNTTGPNTYFNVPATVANSCPPALNAYRGRSMRQQFHPRKFQPLHHSPQQ